MTKLICLAGAAVMALSIPAAADAQNGNGKGKDRGEQGGGDRGEGRGRGGDDRGRGHGGRADRPMVSEPSRGDGPEGRRAEALRVDLNRERGRDDRRPGRDDGRWERDVRRVAVDVAGVRPVVAAHGHDRNFIGGCPPGLAKKNNGCLPPGQARQIARTNPDYPRYDWVWGSRRDDVGYRYDDGYLYRVDRAGGLLGYLPVLGGALSLGHVWPAQYRYEPAPTYVTDYYGLSDRYAYRYADGALYGLDPQTQAITQVAALLTGEQWNVGQPMPSGYDVYNVPYAYRGQYVDSPDSWYRYNDGYVYQVDPTTRLVQTVIQLLT